MKNNFGETLIRDIVYDYVCITGIEKKVVDNKYYQRLRQVYQNSSAFLTFPANQLTRFSHSLGVCHLGSMVFCNSFNNSDIEIQENFITKIDSLFKFLKEEHSFNLIVDKEKISKSSQFNINISEFSKHNVNLIELNNKIYSVWQAFRIACLVHDLGHFPFSHIFETGILSFLEDGGDDSMFNNFIELDELSRQFYCKEFSLNVKIGGSKVDDESSDILINSHEFHELVGLKIFGEILKEIETNEYEVNILKLAFYILSHKKFAHFFVNKNHDFSLLETLYFMLSSELDVDRIDYSLRDVKSSGIDLGNFDYNRIILDARYIVDTEGLLLSLCGENSLTTIEKFVFHRYISYETVYFNPNVCKFDAIAIKIIHLILKDELNELKDILENELLLVNSKFFCIKMFYLYDEAWFRMLLMKIFIKHNSNKNELFYLIDVFLFRNSKKTKSFLKYDFEYDNLVKKFINGKIIDFIELKNNEFVFDKSTTKFIIKNSDVLNIIEIGNENSYLFTKKLINEFNVFFESSLDSINPITKIHKSFSDKLLPNHIIIIKDISPKTTTKTEDKNNEKYTIKLSINNVKEDIIDKSKFLKNITNIKRNFKSFYIGIVRIDGKDFQNEDKDLFESLFIESIYDQIVYNILENKFEFKNK